MSRLTPVGSAETLRLHGKIVEVLMDFVTHNQPPTALQRILSRGRHDTRAGQVAVSLMVLVQKWLDEGRTIREPNPVEAFIEERFQQIQQAPLMWGEAKGVEATCWAWLDIYSFAHTGAEDDLGERTSLRKVIEEVSCRLYPKKGCLTIAGIVQQQEKDPRKAAALVAAAYLECLQEYQRRLDAQG